MGVAMFCVRDHPDWPDREVARFVGVDPSMLARCDDYQRVAALAREPGRDIPRGHVDVDDEGRRSVEGIDSRGTPPDAE